MNKQSINPNTMQLDNMKPAFDKSFVLINPSNELELLENDIIYIIQPGKKLTL